MLKLRFKDMANKYLAQNLKFFRPEIPLRGKGYFLQGRVRDVIFDGKVAKARILGNSVYRVELTFDENRYLVDAKCNCPFNRTGNCKHMAALLYALDDMEEKGQFKVNEGVFSLSDAMNFQKECYNESYRVTYKDVASFYEGKETAILERKDKWSDNEIAANLAYLYTISLPMGVGKKGYEFYLPFVKEHDFSPFVIKESFRKVFEEFPFDDLLKKAFKIEKFVAPINDLFIEELSGSGSLRNIILYNLEEIGDYLDERSLLSILTKASRYAVDYGALLNVYLKRNYKEGIDAISSGPYFLDSASYLKLANYYKDIGNRNKANACYKKMLWNSGNLPISVFVDYYESLTDEEKISQRGDLLAAAEHSKHLNAFKFLIGKGNKNDLKSLKLEDYLSLDKQIKTAFPEEYLPFLLAKLNKKTSSSSYRYEDYGMVLSIFQKYPLALSRMIREDNPFIRESMEHYTTRSRLLPLLRDYGLLKEARIFVYKGGEE